MEEICEIADRESVDVVLIAGDLYDHVNPSIEATELFYKTLKRLARDGKRPVIGIAGNHDSPDRIEAPDPLARECGIILAGYPNSRITPFRLESGLAVTKTDEGFIEVTVPGYDYPLRVILTPYANEIRLRKFLGRDDQEAELRNILQDKWQQLASAYCDIKGVNLLMTHLFMVEKGGEKPEEPEDEKPILTVGGAQEVYTENLPKQIQYVALGHLHRPQTIPHTYPVAYAGSPLSYSMSEAGQQKYVNILTAEPGQEVQVKKVELTAGKKLVRMTFHSVEEAINWLRENPRTLVELTLVSDHFLNSTDRKAIHESHQGIVTIIPKITNPQLDQFKTVDVDLSRDISELFKDYFQYKHGQQPNDRLLDLLKEVLAEDEEGN